ncbi:hypothetical protein Afil01_21320 [Actinorhabdospora filicis]|uniref:Uncharacterized protein n=1 Tax=Actinorhabdospora filicis TaxID=1785913 RepID=A0A9W6SJY9_9ACTN|nr:hypothetical protein Afil01_21320 [Actinorhabdospora filicis]
MSVPGGSGPECSKNTRDFDPGSGPAVFGRGQASREPSGENRREKTGEPGTVGENLRKRAGAKRTRGPGRHGLGGREEGSVLATAT